MSLRGKDSVTGLHDKVATVDSGTGALLVKQVAGTSPTTAAQAQASGIQATNSGANPASGLVVKVGPCLAHGFNAFSTAAGFVQVYDLAAIPADGTTPVPVAVLPIGANAGLLFTFPNPLAFSTGFTLVFSSAGPVTTTKSATAFLAGYYK